MALPIAYWEPTLVNTDTVLIIRFFKIVGLPSPTAYPVALYNDIKNINYYDS